MRAPAPSASGCAAPGRSAGRGGALNSQGLCCLRCSPHNVIPNLPPALWTRVKRPLLFCLQLASIGCPNEEPMRRDLREMLFTAPGIENYISGVVSARQRWACWGQPSGSADQRPRHANHFRPDHCAADTRSDAPLPACLPSSCCLRPHHPPFIPLYCRSFSRRLSIRTPARASPLWSCSRARESSRASRQAAPQG